MKKHIPGCYSIASRQVRGSKRLEHMEIGRGIKRKRDEEKEGSEKNARTCDPFPSPYLDDNILCVIASHVTCLDDFVRFSLTCKRLYRKLSIEERCTHFIYEGRPIKVREAHNDYLVAGRVISDHYDLNLDVHFSGVDLTREWIMLRRFLRSGVFKGEIDSEHQDELYGAMMRWHDLSMNEEDETLSDILDEGKRVLSSWLEGHPEMEEEYHTRMRLFSVVAELCCILSNDRGDQFYWLPEKMMQKGKGG